MSWPRVCRRLLFMDPMHKACLIIYFLSLSHEVIIDKIRAHLMHDVHVHASAARSTYHALWHLSHKGLSLPSTEVEHVTSDSADLPRTKSLSTITRHKITNHQLLKLVSIPWYYQTLLERKGNENICLKLINDPCFFRPQFYTVLDVTELI